VDYDALAALATRVLDSGADGAILAASKSSPSAPPKSPNSTPRARTRPRAVDRRSLELNDAVSAKHGVPGLKAAMRSRGQPAGTVRSLTDRSTATPNSSRTRP